MGSQHEFYLIAKIRPHGGGKATYRCIGALCAQWYHGSMPVSAARRAIQLFRVPDNAQIVQEELRAIDGKYGPHGREEPVIPHRPCPYTLFLLNLAVHSSFEPGDYFIAISGSHRAAGSAREGISRLGCTVFDVTEAGNPACSQNLGSPLRYLKETERRVYRSLQGKNESELDEYALYVKKLADFVSDVPVIEEEHLQETWSKSSNGDPSADGRLGAVEGSVVAPSIPSLTDLTLGPSVKQALEAGDLDSIAPILDQGEKRPRILDIVRGLSPFLDAAIPVLKELLTQMQSDIAGLQLTGAQLVKYLGSGPVDVLDLSGNAALDDDGLQELLIHIRPIRRLVLFRTAVSSDGLLALLSDAPTLFYHVSELVHPALLDWPKEPYDSISPAFTLEAHTAGTALPGIGAVCIPMLSPDLLLRGITHFVRACLRKGSELQTGAGDAALEAAITAGACEDWATRSVWCTPAPVKYRGEGTWGLALYWKPRTSADIPGLDTSNGRRPTDQEFTDAYNANPEILISVPTYGFLNEDWLQEGITDEIWDARTFLRELMKDGKVGPGGAELKAEGGRPALSEDITREFLEVFDELERKAGVLSMEEFNEMAMQKVMYQSIREFH
ncbi:uncharacterized protein SCHCODRAFT_02636092 [Schizophyllum commune H4-8]|nr:uncharacterized protein SCHCODRAFT_02636092 [Schizophyllum commune H4-8]KAI5888226.1 hypothetical protein SCHCODRAFT_02636092 [Schizophyllum commune H4-8]